MVAIRAVRHEPTPLAVVPPPQDVTEVGDPPAAADPGPTVVPIAVAPQAPEHDLVDEWGEDSFPCSDPPANWR